MAEDNYPDVLLVREAIRLETLPLEIHAVQDGEEALEFISRAEANLHAPCPHAVLLDLNLPKVGGLEVLSRVRSSEKLKHIPAIVFSSSDAPDDRSAAARLGARYFRKPPGYSEFMKIGVVLRQFLEERELL